VSLVPTQSNLA